MLLIFIGVHLFTEIEKEQKIRKEDKRDFEEENDVSRNMISEIKDEYKRSSTSINNLTENIYNLSERTEEMSTKFGTLDKISTEVEHLLRKDIRTNAFLEQIKDFVEQKKTVDADLRKEMTSVEHDLRSLKTTCMGKETIKSMITAENSESTLKENKLIQKLTHELDLCKKDLRKHDDGKLELIENINKLCTKDNVHTMIQDMEEKFETLKSSINLQSINDRIKNLQNDDQILEEKLTNHSTNNKAITTHLEEKLDLTLKENNVLLNNRITEIQEQLKDVERGQGNKFTMSDRISYDRNISGLQNKIKIFEEKINELEPAVARVDKFGETLTSLSSEINRFNDINSRNKNQVFSNVRCIENDVIQLKQNIQGIEDSLKNCTSNLNDNNQLVKSTVETLHNELKSKCNELTEKMSKETDNIKNLKVDTMSKWQDIKLDYKHYTDKFVTTQIESHNKETKRLILEESKKLSSIFEDKLLDNKSDIRTYVLECNGQNQTSQNEIEHKIKIMKQDSQKETKYVESLKSNIQTMQETIDDMDTRLLNMFQDRENEKGRYLVAATKIQNLMNILIRAKNYASMLLKRDAISP